MENTRIWPIGKWRDGRKIELAGWGGNDVANRGWTIKDKVCMTSSIWLWKLVLPPHRNVSAVALLNGLARINAIYDKLMTQIPIQQKRNGSAKWTGEN